MVSHDLLVEIEEKGRIYQELKADRSERDRYYYSEVFPLIRRYFREEERKKIHKSYDALILSVGQSIEPLVLSIEAIQPKKAFFLYTEQTEEKIDAIVEFTGLRPSQFDKEKVDSVDPTPIYEAIKKIKAGIRDGNIAVDFTGGTKAMSGGMAMAGGLIGADLIYIASKWNADDRRSFPGTESLEILSNPYLVFGDIDLTRAQKLWKEGEYHASAAIFDQLAERLPDHFEYRVLAELAKAYGSWEAVDLQAAQQHFAWVLKEGRSQLARMRKEIFTEEEVLKIQKQHDYVAKLAVHMGDKTLGLEALGDQEFMTKLILSFYVIGKHREQQNRLDVAALYLYRMVEMIFQHRLAKYGILPDAPDYSRLNKSEEEILFQINQICKKSSGLRTWTSLPEKLSLSHIHLLLTILHDEVGRVVHPSRLNDAVQARNYSILAHGFKNITVKDYDKLKNTATEVVNRFISEQGLVFEQLLDDYAFVLPRSFDVK